MTPPHLATRLSCLRRRIRSWSVDALLVTDSRDVRYLSGFIGDDSWALVRAGTNHLTVISDSRFEQQVGREAPHVSLALRKGPFSDVLEKLFKRFAIERCAVQASSMTIATRAALVRKLGARRLRPLDDGLLEQRAVKGEQEIATIRKALRCQQDAYRALLGELQPGLSEGELAGRLEMHMRRLGAEGAGFPSIVAVGANASLPHATPGRTKVKRGDIVLVDWGARYDGYCSDLTRVVAVGRMPRRIAEIYRVVLAH
jgi:Xaa-Pro aminopeptidase